MNKKNIEKKPEQKESSVEKTIKPKKIVKKIDKIGPIIIQFLETLSLGVNVII